MQSCDYVDLRQESVDFVVEFVEIVVVDEEIELANIIGAMISYMQIGIAFDSENRYGESRFQMTFQ